MFVHQGTLTLRSDVTTAQIDDIVRGLLDLPNSIPEVATAQVARDAGLAPGNAHLTFRMSFVDAAAWQAYRVHPAHVSVIKDFIAPVLESKAFVQYDEAGMATS